MTGPAPQTPAPRRSEAALAPPPADERAAEKAAAKRKSTQRLRLWIALVAGVLALLCLGGVGVAALLYDKNTKIDRTAPDAVVDNFLRAYLDNRDDKQASLYMCKSGEFAAISALRTEALNREKNFDVKVSVSWSTLKVADVDRTHKSVGTSLVIAGASNGSIVSRRSESWSFDVVDEDGWRVCSATKISN